MTPTPNFNSWTRSFRAGNFTVYTSYGVPPGTILAFRAEAIRQLARDETRDKAAAALGIPKGFI